MNKSEKGFLQKRHKSFVDVLCILCNHYEECIRRCRRLGVRRAVGIRYLLLLLLLLLLMAWWLLYHHQYSVECVGTKVWARGYIQSCFVVIVVVVVFLKALLLGCCFFYCHCCFVIDVVIVVFYCWICHYCCVIIVLVFVVVIFVFRSFRFGAVVVIHVNASLGKGCC